MSRDIGQVETLRGGSGGIEGLRHNHLSGSTWKAKGNIGLAPIFDTTS